MSVSLWNSSQVSGLYGVEDSVETGYRKAVSPEKTVELCSTSEARLLNFGFENRLE